MIAFPLYGDGSAVRDFTFVDDVVAANLAAAAADVAPGTVLNVAGGGETSMTELLALAGEVLGTEIEVARHDGQPGDVPRTGGNIDPRQEGPGLGAEGPAGRRPEAPGRLSSNVR